MGKTALIAIAAFTLIGSFYAFSSSSGMLGTTKRISKHDNEVLARNAALAGYEQAKHRLSNSFSSSEFAGTYEGVSYNVSVQITGSTAKVIALGNAASSSGERKLTITARLRLRDVSDEIADVPPQFMRYALLSEGDLSMGGDMTLDTVKIEGSDITDFNANVHTNGKLSMSGNKAKVKGFGTYKTSSSVTHESVFDPNSNPNHEDGVQQVLEGVDIPANSFSEWVYRAYTIGVDQYTDGNLTLSGSYDFEAMGATRKDPYVWHITGDVTTSGNVDINGYVVFMVEGSVTINGNVTGNTSKGKSENSTAIYANGDVSIGGTVSELWAQIFSKSNVNLDGNPKVYGSVASGMQVKTTGSPTIKYFPASPALTRVFEDLVDTRLELVSYIER